MNQEISAASQNSRLYLNTVVLRQKWLNIRYFGVNTCMSRLQMTETNPSHLKLNFFSSCYGGGWGCYKFTNDISLFRDAIPSYSGVFFLR